MLLSQILAGVPLGGKAFRRYGNFRGRTRFAKNGAGALFIALNGKNSDGRKFIPDALEKGAAAVLYDGDYTPPAADGVLFVRADGDMRQNIARRRPIFIKSVPPYISAVTGTNGKTSIADFTRQLMKKLGYSAASIGTVGVGFRRGGKCGNAYHTGQRDFAPDFARSGGQGRRLCFA